MLNALETKNANSAMSITIFLLFPDGTTTVLHVEHKQTGRIPSKTRESLTLDTLELQLGHVLIGI